MSEQDKVSMGSTFVTGSDEDYAVICDACDKDGQRVQATGYCIDCNVNMCVSCLKFHKKLPSLKDHVIKDNSTLSHSHMVHKPAEDEDQLTDRCTIHPDERIKFYCNSHHRLCCNDCISVDHRQCTDILYIKDVSSSVANSDELTKIQADLQMLVTRLTSTQSHAKWIKQSMDDNYSQTVADIRNLKTEIIDMLDKLENDTIEKAWLLYKEKKGTLESTISVCERAIGETEELIADLENKKRMDRSKRLFISMKNAQIRVRELADEADQLCNKNRYERLSFQPDKQLSNLLSTLTSLGDTFLVKQITNISATSQPDISVKTDRDTSDCVINGIRLLPAGRLALTDQNNMSVKLVDVNRPKLIEEIKIESMPIDITCISEVQIAVTLDKKRCIQVLSVSPTLSKSHTITVPGHYFGIEYIPDKLILVCREPASAVHICDMSGALLQRIETDYSGNKLFTTASRIAISPDHGVMYITDVFEHTVVCLTIDGKLIRKYASNMLKDPFGIACDDGGCAYVCCQTNHTVHQLSHSGQLVRILLKSNLFTKTPFPVAITHGAGNLYISSSQTRRKNHIQVYNLEK